jgi:hypothetical protein
MFNFLKNIFKDPESKISRAVAVCVGLPVIGSAFYWLIGKIVTLIAGLMIIINIAELEREIRSNMEMIINVQGVSLDALRAEMDTKTFYGVEVQQTNGGDLWHFTEEIVYTDKAGKNQKIKVAYSAHIRHKEKKIGYFDFKNQHHWIKAKDNE